MSQILPVTSQALTVVCEVYMTCMLSNKKDMYVLTLQVRRFAELPGFYLLTQFPAHVAIIVKFALMVFVALSAVLFLRCALLNNVFLSYFRVT